MTWVPHLLVALDGNGAGPKGALSVALLRLSLVTEDQGIGRVSETVSPHPRIHIQIPSVEGRAYKGYRIGKKQGLLGGSDG